MPITTKSRLKQKQARTSLIIFLSVFGAFLLIVAVSIWFLGGAEREAQAPSIGGPFQLMDGDGKLRTDQDFRGKYMLIYFGYTFCPDVCPTTLQDVTTALEKLGARAAEIQPLFITVDPKRDTSAVIKQYTAAFSPLLIGLTGSVDQINAVEHSYRVYASPHSTSSTDKSYTVDHSSILYLMGVDGQFLAPIRADQSGSSIASDIERYLQPIKEKS